MDVEHSYDHLAISAMEFPSELVARARSQCPVAHSDQYGGFWILHRYGDIGAAARAPEIFSSAKGASLPHHGFPLAIPPIEIDPPDHAQYRSPLRDAFSPRSANSLEPEARRAVTTLIDNFIERGAADFATELTTLVPATIITKILGIPDEDSAMFIDWAARTLQANGDMEAVMEELEYMAGIYDDRVANPRDPEEDLPSLLLTIQINGEPIAEEMFLGLMSELLSAGLDTTANAGALILDLLSKRTDIRQRLIDDPSLIPSAVEEFLRYLTPLPVLCRTTTKPTAVGGNDIEADSKVQLNWLAANHDPEEFPDPEEIRIDRFPNRHYSFGVGPHRCLGAHLARLELRILIEEVLRRIPDYEVDRSAVIRYPGITRGVASLPVAFTPGPRVDV